MSNDDRTNPSMLTPGDQLPEREYTPTYAHVFMFSAITWNRHMIHYNKDQAVSEGHEDVAVQRGLLGNYFTRYVNDLFEQCFITQVSWKVLATTYPGEPLRCLGIVKKVWHEESFVFVELELQLSCRSRLISTATLTFRS